MRIDRLTAGRRRGFTLVEILCVVVILGIAGAIIVPQISSRNDLKAAAAARVLMADLIYAQNRAITFQKHQYVRFDLVNQAYSLLEGPGMTVVTHPVNKMPYVMRFGSEGVGGVGDVTLVSADFLGQSTPTAQPMLCFDELGTPHASDGINPPDAIQSGAVVVRSGSYKLQVNVEPYTGQISVVNIP